MPARGAVLACAIAATLSACSNGSDDDDDDGGIELIELAFLGPDGSGFVGDQLNIPAAANNINRDLTLETGVPISGNIGDADTNPLDGVEIDFKRKPDGPPLASATTDGLGDFDTVLTLGEWFVEIEGDETFGTLELGPIDVDGVTPLDFSFPDKITLSGTVQDPGLGGLGLAEIEFKGIENGVEQEVTCDGMGLYAVDLIPGMYEVVVEPVGIPADTLLKQKFTLLVDGMITIPNNIGLTEGVTVNGFLVDLLTGMPADEIIEIEPKLPEGSDFFAPAGPFASSEMDGSYSVGPLPVGEVFFQFEPPSESELPFQVFSRMIAGPGMQVEDFDLNFGQLINGTVFQDDGMTGEPDVEISFKPLDGQPKPKDIDADGLGAFEVALFDGRYEVFVKPGIDNDQLPRLEEIMVPVALPNDFTLELGARLTGLVSDGITGGMGPLEDIEVKVKGPEGDLGAIAVTDGGGLYELLVAAGVWDLDIKAKDGDFEEFLLKSVEGVNVALPGPNVQDILAESETAGDIVITGTVFQPDGVTPVPNVVILARYRDVFTEAVSDMNGVFTIVPKP